MTNKPNEVKYAKRPYQGSQRVNLHLDDTDTPTPQPDPDDLGNSEDAGRVNPPTNLEETYAQRYANLRRKEAKDREAFEAKLRKLQEENEKLRSNSPFAVPKTAQELDAWAKEYPDLAGVLATVAEQKAREMYVDLSGKIDEVEKTREEILKDRAYIELKKLHPDIDAIHQDQNFHAWANQQEPEIQNWLFEGYNYKLASKAVQMYKDETGYGKTRRGRPPKQDEADALAASMAVTRSPAVEQPTNNGRRIFKESEVAKMSDTEFERYEEEIDRQIQAGIFITDIPKRSYA